MIGFERLFDAAAGSRVAFGNRRRARARSHSAPPPDDATIDPGVTSISSHPDVRAGLKSPPANEFDRLIDDAEGIGRLADAFRDDATAVLDRLAGAASAGDVGDFRARLDVLRETAYVVLAVRVAAFTPASMVAQITRGVHRICGTLEGRC